MVKVDIGHALGAGLGIIRRKPLAPAVWGLLYFVCSYLPSLVIFGLMLPTFTQMTPGATPDPSKLMAAMAPIQLANLLQMILGIVAFALVNAAVCRAVLEPENDRNLYLRFGAQELWQGLVMVVTLILVGVAGLVVMIPLMIVGVGFGVAASQGSPQHALAMLPVFFLLTFLVFAVIFYLWLRLSMALPMSFAHRQFRLFESWSFTKGNVARLFGLGVVIFIVIMVVEILVALIVAGVGFGVLAGSGVLSGLPSLANTPAGEWMPKVIGWAIPFVLLFSVAMGYLLAFAMAPWADVYRQIAGPNYADVFSDEPAPALA